MQIWKSDTGLYCRVPSGVGIAAQITGSVFGSSVRRTMLVNSNSTANYSLPVIITDTPQYVNGSNYRIVLASSLGTSIGKLISC